MKRWVSWLVLFAIFGACTRKEYRQIQFELEGWIESGLGVGDTLLISARVPGKDKRGREEILASLSIGSKSFLATLPGDFSTERRYEGEFSQLERVLIRRDFELTPALAELEVEKGEFFRARLPYLVFIDEEEFPGEGRLFPKTLVVSVLHAEREVSRSELSVRTDFTRVEYYQGRQRVMLRRRE